MTETTAATNTAVPPSQSVDRLYNLIPSLYRQRDFEQGLPLRALLQVIAEQVNIVENDIAQLYNNWFIETCQSWVIPYIGDLVGFKPIFEGVDPDPASAEATLRGKFVYARGEVANTIANRRRKGTMAALEALPSQVAGWSGRIVPFYRRLRVNQNLNSLRLDRGRSLNLRDAVAIDRLDGPFDRAARLLDVRTINSRQTPGRYNIPAIGLFVWRLQSYPLTQVRAACIDEAGPNCYTFSPLGIDQQLFTLPQRDRNPRRIASELNVPMPIPPYAFTDRVDGRSPCASARYYGVSKSVAIYAQGWHSPSSNAQLIPREKIIPRDLSDWAFEPPEGHVAVDVIRGRIVFPPRQLPDGVVRVNYQYGFSADMGGGEYNRVLASPADAVTLYVSSAAHSNDKMHFTRLGAALERWRQLNPPHAIIEIGDSRIYTDATEIRLAPKQSLQIRAANGARPILQPRPGHGGSPHQFKVIDAPGSCFVLDGLVLAGGSLRLETTPPPDAGAPDTTAAPAKTAAADTKTASAQSADTSPVDPKSANTKPAAAPSPRNLPPRRVTVRQCTLVPGWSLLGNADPRSPGSPSIEVLGASIRVVIQHSIVGSIQILEDTARVQPVEINLTDSIIDAGSHDREALGVPGAGIADAVVHIARCTVIGRVETHAIALAEDSMLLGDVLVGRRQQGCVRFCWIEPRSRTPRRFHCQPDLALQALEETAAWRDADEPDRGEMRDTEILRLRPQFNSLRYGAATYCQLARACAEEIRGGASDESEMGAFHDLFQPQRLRNLLARVQESTPVSNRVAVITAT